MSKPVPLRRGATYHIYNRGNNRENLYREQRNYAHFLRLYARHPEPSAESYAYCLLKNHFHCLVRIKDPDLDPLAEGSNPAGLTTKLSEPSQAFSNLFNAYSKAINKAYGRTGSLFEHPFGRIEVTDEPYFRRLITYIHQNPRKHGFVDDFRDWRHSSYHALISAGATRLKREAVIGWFDTVEGLVTAQAGEVVESEVAALAPDDFD
jgi:putative transposase